jgi:DNA-binding MarR family transcriptional regulator
MSAGDSADAATERSRARTTPLSSAIYQLARAHKAFAASMLRELGLYPNQELLLMQLEGVESRSQSSLVRTLMLDHSTVAKSLRRMEAAGLVSRRPSSSDRRAVDVSLTERGAVLLERIHAVWAQLEATTTSALGPGGTEELVAHMHTIRQRIEDEMATRGITPEISG